MEGHDEKIDEMINLVGKVAKKVIHGLKGMKNGEVPAKTPVTEEKKPKKRSKPDEDAPFQCEGRVWETPVGPCGGGDKSNKKDGLIHEKTRHTVCHDCKLAYQREKRKNKKAKTTDE